MNQMGSARRRRGAAGFALAVAAPLLVLAAWAAPVEWSGAGSGVTVRLIVDGQRATGTFRGAGGQAFWEGEFVGSGSGEQYRGTGQGAIKVGNRNGTVAGTWEATLPASGSGGSIRMNMQGPGKKFVGTIPLSKGGAAALLQCASARGKVTRQPKGGTPVPLQAGGAIRIGDTIETGPNSTAIVTLGDRSVVLLQANSRVSVPDVRANQNGIQRAAAGGGKIWFAVQKVPQGSRFDVETGDVVAAVRGTEFLVETDAEGEVSLTTAEGLVEMEDPSGVEKSVPVAAGNQWTLPPRARRRAALWGAVRQVRLEVLMERWGGMLDEADRAWPHRRRGKTQFWQDRVRRPPGRGAGLEPDGAPGMGVGRPGPGPRRSGPRAGMGQRPGMGPGAPGGGRANAGAGEPPPDRRPGRRGRPGPRQPQP